MRGATSRFCLNLRATRFQSTRPMRGATYKSKKPLIVTTFQSTRPMRGATLYIDKLWGNILISIHAPHAGRDYLQSLHRVTPSDFNPRAPCGARQYRRYMQMQQENISIHAPHAGRDVTATALAREPDEFQSTRPMRGATTSTT